jgi:hypothetical protein
MQQQKTTQSIFVMYFSRKLKSIHHTYCSKRARPKIKGLSLQYTIWLAVVVCISSYVRISIPSTTCNISTIPQLHVARMRNLVPLSYSYLSTLARKTNTPDYIKFRPTPTHVPVASKPHPQLIIYDPWMPYSRFWAICTRTIVTQ